MLQHYNKKLKPFQFRNRTEKITVEDASRILGLPTEGEPFLFNKKAKRTDKSTKEIFSTLRGCDNQKSS